MADIWLAKKRSEVMSRIRKTDSGPERILRKLLRDVGVSFKTYAPLPGTPDLIIEGSRIVVFVHGCFWHGCPQHYRPPNSNMKYWSTKLLRNKARDRVITREVRALGWDPVVVWECEVKSDPHRAVRRVLRRLAKTR